MGCAHGTAREAGCFLFNMPDDPKLPDIDAGLEDVEFSPAAVKALYGGVVAEQRWTRANSEIRFDDVVQELTGKWGRAISCPFHGTDSTPSFYLFAANNDGYCFGCPPKEGYYDNVRFAAKYLNFSRVKALKWLERKWDLPPIADSVLEEEESDDSEIITNLVFADLSETYIQLAIADIQSAGEPELAEEYLRIYYEAEKDESVEPLARVIAAEPSGHDKLKKILMRKASR